MFFYPRSLSVKRSIKSLQATSLFILSIDIVHYFFYQKKLVQKIVNTYMSKHVCDVAIIGIFVAVSMPIELYGNYQYYTFPM